MIGRAAIDERVRECGLREDIVEKDYVLGWVLWGIATDPTLGLRWVFKGGHMPGARAVEGRVYYRGPRQAPGAAIVKLDSNSCCNTHGHAHRA